jgi:Ca2+-binding EF-hand superfamily protein
MAMPDNIEQLSAEMEAVLMKELSGCGPSAQKLHGEKEQAVAFATDRVAKIKEATQKDEERKAQLEAEYKEAYEKAEALQKELDALIVEAEASFGKYKESAATLEDKEIVLDEVEKTFKQIEEAGSSSSDKIKVCTDFVVQKGPGMKEPAPPVGHNRDGAVDMKKNMSALLARINECTRGQESIKRSLAMKKDKALKKGAARVKFDKMQAVFDKYDKDKDGMLSRKEILAYSKGEFEFVLSAEGADIICAALLNDGAKGVKKAQLQELKVSIGIAREKVKDAVLRAEREKREAELAELKKKLEAKIQEASESVKVAEDSMVEAEKATAAVQTEKAPGVSAKAADLLTEIEECDGTVKAAKESATKASGLCDALSEGVDEQLLGDVARQSGPLKDRLARLDSRSSALAQKLTKYREEAKRKEAAELDVLKNTALLLMRYYRCTKKLTNEALFTAMDANKDDRIEESEFLKFFSSCDKLPEIKPEAKKEEEVDDEGKVKEEPEEVTQDGIVRFFSRSAETPSTLTEEELSRVFNYIDEDDEGVVSKAAFLRLLRHYMKVSKETVLTPEFDMKEGKSIRRLDLNEVMEVTEGPVFEEATKCSRIRVKALKDDAEGWTTFAGNQGSVYLSEGGNLFKVIKETILTDSMELGEGKTDSKNKPRKLKEGEILEVREWPSKQEGSGLTRMMCKAKSDGRVGWATTVGNTGITFIEQS